MMKKAEPIPPNQVLIIDKGNIFNELERLKGLDNHRTKLDSIQNKDARMNIRKTVDRYDPKRLDANRVKRNEINNQRKMEELTRENAKIL
jgi:hypothetical protein